MKPLAQCHNSYGLDHHRSVVVRFDSKEVPMINNLTTNQLEETPEILCFFFLLMKCALQYNHTSLLLINYQLNIISSIPRFLKS